MPEALDELRAIAAGREQARTEEVAALLEQALRDGFSEQADEALQSALDTIRGKSGPVGPEDIDEVVGELRPFLQSQLRRQTQGAVVQAVEATYMIGQEDISVSAAANLNVTDRRVMNFLEENATFWVGDHYDSQVQGRIRDAAENVLENEDGVLGRRKRRGAAAGQAETDDIVGLSHGLAA